MNEIFSQDVRLENDVTTSRSGSERFKTSQASMSQQQKGMARLAEAATAHMRRLRRNFSVKNKEATPNTNHNHTNTNHNHNNNNNNNNNNLINRSTSYDAVVVDRLPLRKNKTNTWALRRFKQGRRVTVAGVPKASTFYFNLNDATGAQTETSVTSATAAGSMPDLHPQLTPPLPARPQRTSSAASLASSTSTTSGNRPRVAPPAPPPPPPPPPRRLAPPTAQPKKRLARLSVGPHSRLHLPDKT